MRTQEFEKTGTVTLTTDVESNTLRVEVGNITLRLQYEEAKMLAQSIVRLGNAMWGREWGESTLEWNEDVPNGRPFLLYPRKPKTRPAGGVSKAKALVRRMGK